MNIIGIIGAMALEVETLKAHMSNVRVETRTGMNFFRGTLHGTEAVVVQSGVGKVNAALCVQILVDLYQVTHVINTGIAGSLDAALDICDIAISDDLAYHDFHVGPFGYPWGQVPGMDVLAFPADARMAGLAEELCRAQGVGCKRGRIVSGDQFIAEAAEKEAILAHVGGICTEMEGAAIAHAAYRNGIPFLVIRAISDKADHTAEMDYPTFERLAAERSAKLVEALVQKI